MEHNLSKAEFDAFDSSMRNKELIIHTDNKDNAVVFVDRRDCFC